MQLFPDILKAAFDYIFVYVLTSKIMAPPVEREVLYTDKVPKSPYLNQAVRVGNLMFLAGCLGIDKAKGGMVAGGAAAEAHQLLKNMSSVLSTANATLKNVVKVNVYVKSMNDYAAVNDVYMQYFGTEPKPARTCVQVVALPANANVEMEAVAVVGEFRDLKARL